MALSICQFLIGAVTILAASSITAESIQLQPTQGILIPAPLADNYRITRSAYGGGGGAGPSYSAPAAPSYAAPQAAAPSYSPQAAPVAPIYSAPAPAPAPAPISIPAPPCPRNYVFSCQPSLQPVPCSAPAPAPAPAPAHAYSAQHSGMQGAYSQFAPQYVLPPTSYSVPVVKELY